MTKKELDEIVHGLLEETARRGSVFTKEELSKRFEGEYSAGQQERIVYRYRYLYRRCQGETHV